MICFKANLLLLLAIVCSANAQNSSDSSTIYQQLSELQKARTTYLRPSYTRTQLKVGRALDPDSEQTLNVRTNNGGLATIIVKKKTRGFSNFENPPAEPQQQSESLKRETQEKSQQQQQQPLSELFSSNPPPPIKYGKWSVMSQDDLRKPVYNKPSYRFASYDPKDKKSADLISSFMQHIDNIESSQTSNRRFSEDDGIKNDRSPVHIPVVSTKVNFDPKMMVPKPVSIRSDAVFVKDQNENNQKRGRFLIEIDADGVPVVHGIRVPDDEEDKRKIWRNARVINGELVPYENGYIPKPAEKFGYGQLIYAKGASSTSFPRSLGPFTTSDNFPQEEKFDGEESIGPFSVDDVKNTARSGGDFDYMHGDSRNVVQSRGGFGPFMITDNAKGANTKLIDYIKRINEREGRKDYFVGRSNNLRFPDQPQIQRRMLQYTPAQKYPVSSIYSPAKKENNQDSENTGVRAPVLQYAHPDLGVQPAESMPKTESQPKNKKVEYYTKNVHSDRSPYAIEPASLNSESYYELEKPTVVKYSPMKVTKQGNDYSDDRYKSYNKNPATYPYNYGFIRRVKPERPMWVKFSDQMRDSFQSGFASVQQMARPVIDPIFEATQKISHNLGFRQTQPGKEIENKVDVVYSPATGSIIFPALGLVAGGAALGLGAVAMGRIFDFGLLKRSDEQALFELDLEHKRALTAIEGNPENVYFVMDSSTGPQTSQTRLKRSVKVMNLNNDISLHRHKRSEQSQNSDEVSGYKNDKYDGQEEINYEQIPAEEFDDIFELAAVPETKNDLQRTDDTQVRRRRRSLGTAIDDSLGSILQDIERDVPKASKIQFEDQIKNTDWSNTPCAKKVFCEVMIQQSSDDILVMEKKMYTLFGMMHPALISNLAHHLSEVTDAIRRHDCSPFICYQRR